MQEYEQNMMNNYMIWFKKWWRPGDVTKKNFLNWILAAELLCYMKRLRNKVKNDTCRPGQIN